jgi:putative heme iron utilization protein
MTPADVEQRIADLKVIADWQDELQSKIRRAILRFEFTGLDAEEQERLEAEVETFNQICRCLAGASREAIPQREAA